MAEITKELLMEKRQSLVEAVIINQGGIQMIDHLLVLLEDEEQDALSMEQVAQMVGGNGATAEVV